MQLKEVYYHFGDASVPPPDHRSYTLQVKKDAIDVTIDSYGEILAQHHFDASSRIWKSYRKHCSKVILIIQKNRRRMRVVQEVLPLQ